MNACNAATLLLSFETVIRIDFHERPALPLEPLVITFIEVQDVITFIEVQDVTTLGTVIDAIG